MTAVSIAFVSPATVHAAPTCTSNAIDPDDDGWGYENYRSCRMPEGRPTCSATAEIRNGWGFENGRSCVAATNSGTGNSNNSNSAGDSGRTVIACTAAAINNGDGWGWENNKSCRWTSSTSDSGNDTASESESRSSSSRPTCTDNALVSGGGWGWENSQSCRFDAETTASGGGSGTPQCSAMATDNGGGWGYEDGVSCRWGDQRPGSTALSSDGAAPPPVAAAAPGYDESGRPICLTDSSDGNADGFGYENDRTCHVVEGITATPQDPLLNTRWCQPWAEISYGDYVLQNNTWNNSDVYTQNWSQCIELTGGAGNYVAKWDYNWLRRDQGNEYSVKSYPQVYYGRKTKNTQSGTPEKLGLPAKIYNLPNYKVRYRYSETGSPERNVALESFFHTSCEAEEWNKHFEMMIWVGKPSTKTPGTLVAEARIDGQDWDIYTNPSLGWGYVAFVVKETSNEGWLDWNKFVEWTRTQGPSVGVWPIGNNTCMGAIEIGTETFWGTGTFTLHEFRVTR